MAYGSLQQTIWSAMLDATLQKALVYGALTNKNYESDASNANIVAINTLGAVSVYDYLATGSNIVDDLSSTSQSLSLNQKKYFSAVVEDFVRIQSNVALATEFGNEAGYAIADTMDSFLASLSSSLTVATQVSKSDHSGAAITHVQSVGTEYQYNYNLLNSGSTELVPSQSVSSFLASAGKILDKNNVPRNGRWAVVSPEGNRLLTKDLGINSAVTILANGLVQGQNVGGFQIYVSNNVPGTADVNETWMAGHPVAWTFARQLSAIESFRSQTRFGDEIRGLYIYGGLVLKPSAIAFMHAKKF